MSVLPISTNRPLTPAASRSDASTKSPPASPVRRRSRPSASLEEVGLELDRRDEARWASSRPAWRSWSHLAGLAVPNTSGPQVLGHPHGGPNHTAGGGMDEHGLTGAQPGQLTRAYQAVR